MVRSVARTPWVPLPQSSEGREIRINHRSRLGICDPVLVVSVEGVWFAAEDGDEGVVELCATVVVVLCFRGSFASGSRLEPNARDLVL